MSRSRVLFEAVLVPESSIAGVRKTLTEDKELK